MSATPGPWKFGSRYSQLRDEVVSADGGRVVAIVPTRKQPELRTEVALTERDTEGEANFTLIAAAPELLEALRGMLSIENSVTQGQERELRAEWLPKARAAIAKAEGQS